MLAGVDEAGRGALAGPLVAAAVILSEGFPKEFLKDSKIMSAAERETAYTLIFEHGCAVGVGVLSHRTIDRINILRATMLAMERAVKKLSKTPREIEVDGNRAPNFSGIPVRCVVQGDKTVSSISAASIVAKVTRDRIMDALAKKFPVYDFAEHKGYGTARHYDLIFEYGVCDVHRKSFNLTRQEKLFG